MQSSGSRSTSPDPEQDTLLEPLNSTVGTVSDSMPSKQAGNERGIMDNLGLGLVYVRRISPFRA